jgi:RimJ/RimL family protein N-acetyltransferase
MATLTYDNQDKLIAWASECIGFTPRSDAQAMGWVEGERLIAVTVWDGFSECDCNIHVASNRTGHWLTRGFLRASFAHPFIQWKMRRVTALVPASNARAIRFDLHLGFEREGLIRHALPDDDLIVMGMLRENCRHIPEQHRR